MALAPIKVKLTELFEILISILYLSMNMHVSVYANYSKPQTSEAEAIFNESFD